MQPTYILDSISKSVYEIIAGFIKKSTLTLLCSEYKMENLKKGLG
jgi:hypothetical protein